MSFITYLTILIVYVPGLILIFKKRLLLSAPIPSVYFISIFILNALGSFYVINSDENRHIYFLDNLFTIEYYLFLVIQPIIFYVFFGLFNSRKSRLNEVNFSIKETIVKRSFYSLWLISLILVVVNVVTNGLPPIFFEGLTSFTSSDIVNVRTDSTVNSGDFTWTSLGYYTFPQIATLISFLSYKLNKNVNNRLQYLISFVLALILSVSFLHKTPIIMLLFLLLLGSMLLEQKINYKKIFYVLITVLSVLFLFYIFYFNDRDSSYYLEVLLPSMFHRIVGSYTVSLAAVVPFSELNGYFYGHTFINPLGLLPFEPVSLPGLIHSWIMGSNGRWPIPAVGEAFINFGWLGFLLFIFIINYFIFSVQAIISHLYSSNRIMWTFLSAFICFTVYQLATTSIFNGILSPVFIVTLIIVFVSSVKIRWN